MKYLFMVSLICIGVFAFSPGQYTPAFIVNHDKAAHTLTFFVLTFLMHRSFRTLTILYITIFAILLGIAIELIQFFFTSRGFSLEDLMYDAVGIALYIMTYFVIYFFQKSKEKA